MRINKILSVVLAAMIVMTVVSSMAFASTNEITLNGVEPQVYNYYQSYSSSALKPDANGVYNATRGTAFPVVATRGFFGGTGPKAEYANARYLKVSYDLAMTGNVTQELKAYRVCRQTGATTCDNVYMNNSGVLANYVKVPEKASGLMDVTKLTGTINVAYVTDVVNEDVYYFINDVLVGAFIDCTPNYSGYDAITGVGFRIVGPSKLEISNVDIKAYTSAATFDEMGLYIGLMGESETETNADGTHAIRLNRGYYIDSMIVNDAVVNVTAGSKISFYAAEYDEAGKLVYTRLLESDSANPYTYLVTPQAKGTTTMKAYLFDKTTLRPYAMQGTVKDIR